MARQLWQLLVYVKADGNWHIEGTLSKNPLHGCKRSPQVELNWRNGDSDFYCAFWAREGRASLPGEDAIKMFCEAAVAKYAAQS